MVEEKIIRDLIRVSAALGALTAIVKVDRPDADELGPALCASDYLRDIILTLRAKTPVEAY